MGPIELMIGDLLLDCKNPRIEGADSQRGALQKILDDQKEKIAALAKSIVEENMNPMDRLLVLKANGERYTTLEGNRRVAALKILTTPSILKNMSIKASVQKSLEVLAKKFDPKNVEPISCYEVPDRDTGESWIHLRHTGENDGKGVVSWSGIAASRFRGQDPALQALDFVQTYGRLTDEQKKILEARFPITTLNRLLSSLEVRKRLGFDVKDRKLVTSLPPAEIMKPLRRMVLDLAEGIKTVSDLKNQRQQVDYVESFDASSKPNHQKMGKKQRTIEGIEASEFVAPKQPVRRKRLPTDPSERRVLINPNARLNVTIGRIARIVKELRALRLVDAPNAIAVLFRVFLELSVDHHLKSRSIPLTFKEPNSQKVVEKNSAGRSKR